MNPQHRLTRPSTQSATSDSKKNTPAFLTNDGLYNIALGLPLNACAPWVGDLPLRYGSHAQGEANRDRYGAIPLFEAIEVHPGDVVEVQVFEGKAVKAVVRIPFDDRLDLVYVLSRPEGSAGAFVKTVWLNEVRDSHRTLNRSAYRRPEKSFVAA